MGSHIGTPLVGRKTSAFGISCVGSSSPYARFVFLDLAKHNPDVTFKDGISSDVTAFGELSQKLKAANSARGLSQISYQNLYPSNSHRSGVGPDAQGFYRVIVSPNVDERQSPLLLEFFASELRLRGEASVVQPHEKEGDVLCWNGEVFSPLHDIFHVA